MKIAPISIVAVLIAAFAGCSGPASQRDTNLGAAPTDAPPSGGTMNLTDPDEIPIVGPPFLDFKDCSELNILVPVPADEFGDAGPLKLKPADPLGLTLNLIFTAMACDSLDASGRHVAKPIGIYAMAPVEPHPELKLDGVQSYYWLGFAATEHLEIRSILKNRGVEVEKAKITLKFDALANSPKARASMDGTISDFHVNAESVMTGSPVAGPAGSLGLYTFKEDKNGTTLWVHRVSFTTYKAYDKGVVVVRPSFLPIPDVVEIPQPVAGYHNIDYGARFDFDQGLWET